MTDFATIKVTGDDTDVAGDFNFNEAGDSVNFPEVASRPDGVRITSKDAAPSRLSMVGFGVDNSIRTFFANGTGLNPTAIPSGYSLGSFMAHGFGGLTWDYFPAGGFSVVAEENWTETARGARLSFRTRPVGATGQATVVWHMRGNGCFHPAYNNTIDIGLPSHSPRHIYTNGLTVGAVNVGSKLAELEARIAALGG